MASVSFFFVYAVCLLINLLPLVFIIKFSLLALLQQKTPIGKPNRKPSITLTPASDNRYKSPSPSPFPARSGSSSSRKYSNVPSKIVTRWTPDEQRRLGLSKLYQRASNATSASSSASSSTCTSPNADLSKVPFKSHLSDALKQLKDDVSAMLPTRPSDEAQLSRSESPEMELA